MGIDLCCFANQPPSLSDFSTNLTSYPVLAASKAAVIPAIPPPTTRMPLSISSSGRNGSTGDIFWTLVMYMRR